MSRQLQLSIFFIITTVIALALIYEGPMEDRGRVFTGNTMGTTFSIQAAECKYLNCNDLDAKIRERLEALENRLSHYRHESELSIFNEDAGDRWFPASVDLMTVVNFALELSRASSGAFDITVAPAVDAWGFGPPASSGIPDEQTIADAQSRIGYEKLQTRPSPRAIRKTSDAVKINLSALAKGYAVDQLALLLEDQGILNYLVEIGGEVRTAGARADGQAWRIGIESPDGSLDIEYIVAPGDEAVATSGDYRNFYIEDGERISHTIDPANARPVDNGLASVSVIAPSAMQADALATLFMVLGEEQAFEWAEQSNIPLLIITREQGVLRAATNTAFDAYTISK